MNPESQYVELKELIIKNQELLAENNTLLKKLHRSAVRNFWFNVAWIGLFIILPLLAIVKLILPFYASLGQSSSTLDSQLNNLEEIQNLLKQQR